MMLERIKIGIDKKLQKEQAGFRPKRSTMEEIFILRNILEQATGADPGEVKWVNFHPRPPPPVF